MFRKPEVFSPPRPPTEREKSIIHAKMLEEIEKIQKILKECEIDAEFIRESDRRYCTQVATRMTTSIFMEYNEKFEFENAYRQDPVILGPTKYASPEEWEKITTLEKKKAIQDKTKAEERLGEIFDIFEPVKVRKVTLATVDEAFFYIIKVITWEIFPLVCAPFRQGECKTKPMDIALRSLSMKNPFPWDEEEEFMPGGWTPPRPADRDIQKMTEKFKSKVQKEMNTVFVTFEAVSYQTQVVDGVNYSVKIESDDGFLWMVLYQPAGGEVQFVGVYTHNPN